MSDDLGGAISPSPVILEDTGFSITEVFSDIVDTAASLTETVVGSARSVFGLVNEVEASSKQKTETVAGSTYEAARNDQSSVIASPPSDDVRLQTYVAWGGLGIAALAFVLLMRGDD